MFDLAETQRALKDFNLDGWLLYDFRGSNLLARRVLDLESRPLTSRRFFYFIPATGQPTRIVHRIETGVLDHLPGSKQVYLRWQELEAALKRALENSRRVAMEFAPGLSNPYISRVDGGTVEAVRAFVPEIASSGDLIQLFESTWDDDQWAMHLEADRHTRAAFDLAWSLIARKIKAGETITECQVQSAIMNHFHTNGLTTYSPPIVAVGPHSGDPHFENTPQNDTPIRAGDFVLLDLWAKLDKPRAVYSDLTRVAFVGSNVPSEYEDIFSIVARARDAGIACVKDAFAARRPLRGFEVDDATRAVIDQAGYGQYFIHRTGHNIGQEVHGNGAHMDNLETHEERLVLPRTCFSIEPGIYQEAFGVRSEIDVFIDKSGAVHVTGGPPQSRVVPLLADF
jgi:Xaa-Pro aminopeptidase